LEIFGIKGVLHLGVCRKSNGWRIINGAKAQSKSSSGPPGNDSVWDSISKSETGAKETPKIV